MKNKDVNSLDHTSWRCQYHIVFAPKYRRMEIYGEIKVDIGRILRQMCQQKGIEIIEAELCKDHIHMLVSIPPEVQCVPNHGVSQGKERLNDLRPTRQSKVQVWQSAFLSQRVFRRYGRKEQKNKFRSTSKIS